MTGTVLYDGKSKRPAAEAYAQPNAREAYLMSAEELHVAHELVAISNDADYCLCGNTWPCEKRSEY